MNQEATVRRYHELIDEGACDELVELFAEDDRYERPGRAAIEDRGALWSPTRRDGRWGTAVTTSSGWSSTVRRSPPGGALPAARSTRRSRSRCRTSTSSKATASPDGTHSPTATRCYGREAARRTPRRPHRLQESVAFSGAGPSRLYGP